MDKYKILHELTLVGLNVEVFRNKEKLVECHMTEYRLQKFRESTPK